MAPSAVLAHAKGPVLGAIGARLAAGDDDYAPATLLTSAVPLAKAPPPPPPPPPPQAEPTAAPVVELPVLDRTASPLRAAAPPAGAGDVSAEPFPAPVRWFFLHHFVDDKLPLGFYTVPRSRRQLLPLEAYRATLPPALLYPLPPSPAPSAAGAASASSEAGSPAPPPAAGVVDADAAPPSPPLNPAEEAAILYVVSVEARDAALAALRRRVQERLASVRSQRFHARVAELIAAVRQAMPLAMPAVFQRHVEALTAASGSVVVPLGTLAMGRPEEMALLFKLLCDDAGLDCRLVRGWSAEAPNGTDYAWAFVREDHHDAHPWLLVDVATGAKWPCPSDEAAGFVAEDTKTNGVPGPGRPFGCTAVADSPAAGELFMPARTAAAQAPTIVYRKAHLPEIDCACGQVEEFGLMVECSACQRWSHGACRGLDRRQCVPPDFRCWRCQASAAPRTPVIVPPPPPATVVSTLVATVPATPGPASSASASGSAAETPLRVKLVLRLPATPAASPSGTNGGAAAARRGSVPAAARKPSSPGASVAAGAAGRRASASASMLTPPVTPDRRRRSSTATTASGSAAESDGDASTPTSEGMSPSAGSPSLDGAPSASKLRRRDSRSSVGSAGALYAAAAGRRRTSTADFDINDVVATGVVMPSAIKPLEVKPVFTPGWHLCEPAPAEAAAPMEGVAPLSADAGDDLEDDSDEHYMRMHAPFERAEQKRLPIIITQERRGSGPGEGMVRTVSASALPMEVLFEPGAA